MSLSVTQILLVTSILLLGNTHALADQYLVLEGFSYHMKKSDERNALNLGLGIESSPTHKWGWQVGTFRDSFHQNASYAGLNYALKPFPLLGQKARFIPSLNVVRKKFAKTEYVRTRVIPLPTLEVCINGKMILNVSGSPALDYDQTRTNGVVFLSLKLPMQQKAAHC